MTLLMFRHTCQMTSLFGRTFVRDLKPVVKSRSSSAFPRVFSLNARCLNVESKVRTKMLDSKCFHKGYVRYFNRIPERSIKNRSTMYYCTAFVLIIGGLSYSSVFVYRMYCQATGKGGTAYVQDVGDIVKKMKPNKKRLITVNFNADLHSQMTWNFKPYQPYIKVSPGETALAFYSAKNPTDRPVTGIATYNVLPYDAGKYFNKIQCFCFEEQQLNPHEEVDLPVFFYLDPEYSEDPRLEDIDDIILSYTFFEAKEGLQLPLPSFSSN